VKLHSDIIDNSGGYNQLDGDGIALFLEYWTSNRKVAKRQFDPQRGVLAMMAQDVERYAFRIALCAGVVIFAVYSLVCQVL